MAGYLVMAEDDDYDPTNPKYITAAADDEVEHKKSKLLEDQIAKLEFLLEKEEQKDGSNSSPSKFKHYEQVLAELRYESSGNSPSRTHARVRSSPECQTMPDDAPRVREFTHARGRSTPGPAPSCWDTDVLDCEDSPVQANRVLAGSPMPGHQLRTVGNAAPSSIEEKWLASPQRPSPCTSPKLAAVSPAYSARLAGDVRSGNRPLRLSAGRPVGGASSSNSVTVSPCSPKAKPRQFTPQVTPSRITIADIDHPRFPFQEPTIGARSGPAQQAPVLLAARPLQSPAVSIQRRTVRM